MTSLLAGLNEEGIRELLRGFLSRPLDQYQRRPMSDTPQLNPEVAAERARCIKILEGEIDRGRSLLGLLDMSGRPVFDDKLTMAGMEAIAHCLRLLRE